MPRANTPPSSAAPPPAAVKTAKKTKASAGSSKASKTDKKTDKKARTTTPAASPVDDAFIEAQRSKLIAEREGYERSAATLRAEADQLAQDREPGDVQFDEESGEGDSMNVERERDLALSAQAMESIEEIDRALAKIDQGTYGICERCDQPIPHERMEALPHAALCVRCKSGGLGRH
jgi:DnaK suppressor protein